MAKKAAALAAAAGPRANVLVRALCLLTARPARPRPTCSSSRRPNLARPPANSTAAPRLVAARLVAARLVAARLLRLLLARPRGWGCARAVAARAARAPTAAARLVAARLLRLLPPPPAASRPRLLIRRSAQPSPAPIDGWPLSARAVTLCCRSTPSSSLQATPPDPGLGRWSGRWSPPRRRRHAEQQAALPQRLRRLHVLLEDLQGEHLRSRNA